MKSGFIAIVSMLVVASNAIPVLPEPSDDPQDKQKHSTGHESQTQNPAQLGCYFRTQSTSQSLLELELESAISECLGQGLDSDFSSYVETTRTCIGKMPISDENIPSTSSCAKSSSSTVESSISLAQKKLFDSFEACVEDKSSQKTSTSDQVLSICKLKTETAWKISSSNTNLKEHENGDSKRETSKTSQSFYNDKVEATPEDEDSEDDFEVISRETLRSSSSDEDDDIRVISRETLVEGNSDDDFEKIQTPECCDQFGDLLTSWFQNVFDDFELQNQLTEFKLQNQLTEFKYLGMHSQSNGASKHLETDARDAGSNSASKHLETDARDAGSNSASKHLETDAQDTESNSASKHLETDTQDDESENSDEKTSEPKQQKKLAKKSDSLKAGVQYMS
ncbi:hypothetical protein BDEG_22860 [Batrachochytrium dendrobatidis JEL423]|uniref:Uncharacterized protein n=1 Tax=Batrachochytrium dendrobatidis (strain JEL423) TaxID=403673 RepID=A0A177WGS2_BATDL|nr:hypothetical protein BDEG_22860 [Batrachochytrium dendrobatidis JEL423]